MPKKYRGISVSSDTYAELIDIGTAMGLSGPDLKVAAVIRALMRVYRESRSEVDDKPPASDFYDSKIPKQIKTISEERGRDVA